MQQSTGYAGAGRTRRWSSKWTAGRPRSHGKLCGSGQWKRVCVWKCRRAAVSRMPNNGTWQWRGQERKRETEFRKWASLTVNSAVGANCRGRKFEKSGRKIFQDFFLCPSFLCCVRNYEIARRGTQIALYMWLARYIHSFVWGGQKLLLFQNVNRVNWI